VAAERRQGKILPVVEVLFRAETKSENEIFGAAAAGAGAVEAGVVSPIEVMVRSRRPGNLQVFVMSGEPIRRIDCIDKTNTENSRGCKGHRGLYTGGGSKASKATAGVYTRIRNCGTKPLIDTMTPSLQSYLTIHIVVVVILLSFSH
jgi:hypothetical protein